MKFNRTHFACNVAELTEEAIKIPIEVEMAVCDGTMVLQQT